MDTPNASDFHCATHTQSVSRHTLAVNNQYRLYPEILDNSLINRARIEARLRNSHSPADVEESFLSTDYIELTDPDNY